MGATAGGVFGWVLELVARTGAQEPAEVKGALPGVVATVPAGNGGLVRPARFAPAPRVEQYVLAA